MQQDHEYYMNMAIREAEKAGAAGEVPVGAVLVRNGEIIGKAHNQTELLKDPTAHAEILAITQGAAAVSDWRLTETTLYITKEPCCMCAGAIVLARIPLIVWGADDPKRGGGVSLFPILENKELNHQPTIIRGILEEPSLGLLQSFFQQRRRQNDMST